MTFRLYDPDEDTSWFAAATCKGMDPNIFHPVRGEQATAARAVCDGCPVRQTCLDWAIAHKSAGVWGGTSGRERRQLRYSNTDPIPRRSTRTDPLTPDEVRAIRKRAASGELQGLIAADYGLTRDHVSYIATRRSHRSVA